MLQGSDEWLEWRKTMIMASDAPIIMEVSPYRDSGHLWLEKMGMADYAIPSFAMREGKRVESLAIAEFESLMGIETFPFVMTSATIPWMGASLDGMSVDGSVIVEVKRNNKLCHEMALAGIVPKHHFPQVQHQIFVVELDRAYYVSSNGYEVVIVDVFRNDDYIKIMIEKEFDFYQSLTRF